MQGTIAQVIAITAHGNGFLRGIVAPDTAAFYPANSTFKFCEDVKFVTLQTQGKQRQECSYAANPMEWVERLGSEGVDALRLRYVSDVEQKVGGTVVPAYQLVGFIGGGGRWLIEASKQSKVDYWEGRWEVGDRQRKDQKIWRITYGCVAQNQNALPAQTTDLENLKVHLNQELRNIAAFARAQKLDHFAQAFERGLVCLDASKSPGKLWHDDMVLPGLLLLIANQLLNAVQAGWVFGAMGSWNDLSFAGDDQKRYEQLSAELYSLFIQAVVAATNTSAASTPLKTRRWWQWFK